MHVYRYLTHWTVNGVITKENRNVFFLILDKYYLFSKYYSFIIFQKNVKNVDYHDRFKKILHILKMLHGRELITITQLLISFAK